MTHIRPLYCLVTSLLLGWAGYSAQGAIYVPPGLRPNDTYHLAFVTDGARDGISTLIGDYNTFVQNEAERPGAFTETFGISWGAIASTSATHARNNALVSAPVYLLNGTKIADDFSDTWDGTLDAPLNVTQFLAAFEKLVWTGSDNSGFAVAGNSLGSGGPRVGDAAFASSDWINRGTNVAQRATIPLYALSQVLTVPAAAVPEPGTFVVWGGMILVGASVVALRKKYCRA